MFFSFYNTESRISLEILEQCSSNLAPEMYIMKETKWHLWHCCYDNSFAADSVLIRIEIPSFCLNQVSFTPSNLMRRVKTIWEPCLFRARPFVAHQRVGNVDIWLLTERDWSQESCMTMAPHICDVFFWCKV